MSDNGFDWLKEYGPHWQPGSLAFWMAPETPEDMVSWLMKYRPELMPSSHSNGLHGFTIDAQAQQFIALNGYQQYPNAHPLQQASNPYMGMLQSERRSVPDHLNMMMGV